MSLKAFHIFFIAVSLLLTLGVGGWSLWQYLAEGRAGQLWLGLVCLGGAVGLIIYGKKMLRKLKGFDLI